MGFNYRKERKKFEEEMAENEKRYRSAGMSDSQIHAMREYEEEIFRRERVYGIHTVFEESKEYPGLIELEKSNDSYFQELSASLDNLLDNLVPGLSESLSVKDKEVLLLLSRGLNQQEAANLLGVSQQAISKHMKKIKLFLKRGL